MPDNEGYQGEFALGLDNGRGTASGMDLWVYGLFLS